MANPRQANVSDHDYDFRALEDSYEEEETVLMEHVAAEDVNDPICLNSPNPKRMKKRGATKKQDGASNASLAHAMQAILTRFDGLDSRMDEIQTALKRFDDLEKKLEGIENRMDGIGKSTKENKENIVKLQERVEHLSLENKELREKSLESERYKRRWDLRLMGVPEKDNENTREVVLGILTRVVPMSVEKLRDTVDTVHRLGKRGAVNNNMPRAIIIQFAMRTVRDEVWRKSKEARVCKEMKIYFREDFSKEDREARAKLWPMVEQARRSGKRAFLKEGYALIEGRKVMP